MFANSIRASGAPVHKRLYRIALISSCAASCCLGAGMASAQDAAQPQASDQTSLEDIVVTAQRRSENLQSVPLAVTALSSASLARSGIQDTTALTAQVPGLVFMAGIQQGNPYIRGIGTQNLGVGIDSPVATHVNGVYQSRPAGSLSKFYDINRVEVLKGPQGTLYGRNATGGAINIITEEPKLDSIGGYVQGEVGNFGTYQAQGALNVPISEGTIAARIAFIRDYSSGFMKAYIVSPDQSPFAGGRSIGREVSYAGNDLWAFRPQILFKPSDDVRLLLSSEFVFDRSNKDQAFLPINSSAFPYGALRTSSPYHTIQNLDPSEKNNQVRLSATLDWTLGDFATFTSVTGYNHGSQVNDQDADTTNVDISRQYITARNSTFTQELRLASATSTPFKWVAGLFYFKEKAHGDIGLFVDSCQVGACDVPRNISATDITFEPIAQVDSESYAAFAQGTYEVLTGLSLTLGGRYTHEKKRQQLSIGTTPVQDATTTASAFTPKFGIEFKPGNDILIYANASKGFHSGGFNSFGAQPAFSPEKIWAYEVGMKSEFLDHRLRLNLNGFYYDYSDLQVNSYNPSGVAEVRNAATAVIKGIELEGTLKPFRGLTIDGNVTYLDAYFKNFPAAQPPAGGAPVDASGNTLPVSPKWKSTLGAQFEHQLGGLGSLTWRAEWTHTSTIYFEATNDPAVSQSPVDLINARLTFEPTDGRWTISAYVKNLTKKVYSSYTFRADFTNGTQGVLGEPRTFGVNATYRF